MSSLDSTQSFTVCWQIDKEWVKRALHLSGLETRDELNTELRALIAPDGPHRDLQFKSIQKKLLRTQQELDIIPKYVILINTEIRKYNN
jgi:hypothetical protein